LVEDVVPVGIQNLHGRDRQISMSMMQFEQLAPCLAQHTTVACSLPFGPLQQAVLAQIEMLAVPLMSGGAILLSSSSAGSTSSARTVP
jgi:hypothetical protein